MNIYDSNGKALSLGKSVGRGGEATVFQISGRPDWLAKIYEPAPRANYVHKLAWMATHPPENPTQAFHHASLAWPAGLLYDSRRRLVGYWMPYIRAAVPIIDVFNPRRRTVVLPKFDRRYLHRAARNLAASIAALHSSGYVVGDINESNVLVTPSALVTLIDTDSFQVNEQRSSRSIIHYCPVGKPEYSPPELQGKPVEKLLRLPEQDAFGLGVLIFQLLMEGSHPFRAQWLGNGDPPPIEARIAQGAFPYAASPSFSVRPPRNAPDLNSLHPELVELVRRSFTDGHRDAKLRPTAAAWERALAEAENALVSCPRGHIYSNHLRFCPACPAPPRQPVSEPAAAGRKGQPHRTDTPAKASPKPFGFPFFTPRGTPSNAPRNSPRTQPAAASQSPAAGSPPSSSQQQGTGTPTQSGQAPFTAGHQQTSAGPAAARPGPPAGSHPPRTTGSSPTGKPASAGASRSAGTTSSGAHPQAQKRPGGFRFSSPWIKPPPARAQGSSPRPKAGSSGRAQASPNPSGSTAQTFTWRTAWSWPRTPWPAQGHAARKSTPPAGANPWGNTLNWQKIFSQLSGQLSGNPWRGRPGTSGLPARPQAGVWNWARPRLLKSLAVGGGIGALAGILPGALAGMVGWASGETAAWMLLCALGGAAGGMARGYQPGYRLSQWVHQNIGWQRVWPALGLVAGALGGGFIGLVLGWWAIFPIFVGLYLGARSGAKLGQKIWLAGNRLGWERIWAVAGALSAALLGWVVARWASASGLGTYADQFAGSLGFWLVDHSASWTLVWAVIGAIGGALGGAVAGVFADLWARLAGLVD